MITQMPSIGASTGRDYARSSSSISGRATTIVEACFGTCPCPYLLLSLSRGMAVFPEWIQSQKLWLTHRLAPGNQLADSRSPSCEFDCRGPLVTFVQTASI